MNLACIDVLHAFGDWQEVKPMYIYCETCGAGFHSNVASCPGCGAPSRRAHAARFRGTAPRLHGRQPHHRPREDVESEVWELIYGWRTGTVELRDGAVGTASDIRTARTRTT